MNNLMQNFSKERTTTHFRDLAILQIKIAYRIMEYLEPDEYFKPKNILKEFYYFCEFKMWDECVNIIFIDVGKLNINCSSSIGSIREEAKELIKKLYKK